MDQFMEAAIREAVAGIVAGHGGPFGAVVVRAGRIVGRGHNQVVTRNDPTAHAEINAIREACGTLSRFDLATDAPSLVSRHGPAIRLCTEGHLRVENGLEPLDLERGAACVVPAGSPAMEISGVGPGFLAALSRQRAQPRSRSK